MFKLEGNFLVCWGGRQFLVCFVFESFMKLLRNNHFFCSEYTRKKQTREGEEGELQQQLYVGECEKKIWC